MMAELFWFLTGCAVTLCCLLWITARTRRIRNEAGAGDPPPRQGPPPKRAPTTTSPQRIVLAESRPLEELSEALGNELASLASGVEGHAQLLCECLDQPDRVDEQSEQLWESVRRLRFFSEKLQSFAEVPPLDVEPTDIAQLLAVLVLEIEDYARGSLQVNLSLAPSLPFARANPAALRTAMLFLTEAVLELEPTASTLILQAWSDESDEEEDALKVRIDIEAVPEDFAETPPAEPSTPIRFSYLAARNLLQAQVASFTLDQTPGLNALASITLEATHKRLASSDPASFDGDVDGDEPHQPHQFGGVLIMEGNPTIRDMLGRELRKTSRNIISCADGVAARSLFGATPERFELMILEQESRRMRGDAMALEAFAKNPDLEIILITPGPGATVAPDLAGRSGLHVLHKPFGIMELRDILSDTLGPEPRSEQTARPCPVDAG